MTRRAAALLGFALLAAACGGDTAAPPLITTTTVAPADGGDAPASTSTAPEEAPTSSFVLPEAIARQVDCPDRIAGDGVACGLVDVALDATRPGAGTATISIATMAGFDDGFRTPLAVLQGGPGGASSDFAGWLPRQAYTQVFVDQRGTGFAGAEFDCVEYDDAIREVVAADGAAAAELTVDAFAACADRLGDDPLLAETTTQNHAYDVGQVMAALGYDRWLAYGVSYGSTIGFELLRQPPAGLVGVVLDGVYPPTLDVDAAVSRSAEASIAAVGAACRESVICSDYDDDIEGTLAGLIETLDAEPRTVTLSGNESGFGESVDVLLDGTRVAEFVFFILYSESLTRHLPAVLAGIEEREESAERWLARIGTRTIASAYGANDEGTFFAVQCHDRLPFTEDVEPVGTFGSRVAGTPLRDVCPTWDTDSAYDIAGTTVTSDLPALLLSGAFDPITPPAYAEEAAETLSASTVVTQAGRGHGIWIGDRCIASIVQAFVADPLRDLDTSCAEEGVAVDWARP